jgi:RNA 3'-terminal phosphate cyclase (ATP)
MAATDDRKTDTLTFIPHLPPSSLLDRDISITADSPAASTLLIFQAVFPFLLFASTPPNSDTHKVCGDPAAPITLRISGGTNVSFSLSFEYLDQVLLPTLRDAFGVDVERRLVGPRGWSLGRQQRGMVELKFRPLRAGETLKLRVASSAATDRDGKAATTGVYGISDGAGGASALPTVSDVEAIDVSMMVPGDAMREALQGELVDALAELFHGVEVNFKVVEDSGAESRIYVLLVARAGTVRWGRDVLQSMPSSKGKNMKATQTTASLCATISRRLATELHEEVSAGGVVDEFLQDQLVIFQALAEGRTSFPRGEDKSSLERAMERLELDGNKLRKEKTDGPIGEGSLHTTTARWVTAQMLPQVAWYNKGYVCEGAGVQMNKPQ